MIASVLRLTRWEWFKLREPGRFQPHPSPPPKSTAVLGVDWITGILSTTKSSTLAARPRII